MTTIISTWQLVRRLWHLVSTMHDSFVMLSVMVTRLKTAAFIAILPDQPAHVPGFISYVIVYIFFDTKFGYF